MASNPLHEPVGPESFRPTASLKMLRLRGELLAFTRAFFTSRGFCEVETPILSHDVVVDAYLEPFVTQAAPDGEKSGRANPLFLQTSPEFGMKRLLACGATAIFQITRAFRRGEQGRYHNPEFTIVEWYRVGSTYREQMDLVEELVTNFFDRARLRRPAQSEDEASDDTLSDPPRSLPRPFARIPYDTAFEMVFGRPVIGRTAGELAMLAESSGIAAPRSMNADDVESWLNLLLALRVEPELASRPAVFVYDYPPGQAALARIRSGTPSVAERFELYLAGIEICNGYQELTDAAELRRRMASQAALRLRDGNRRLPDENRLLDAMEAGLPECAGVALGFDRLLMAAVGASSVAEVMAFPFDRA